MLILASGYALAHAITAEPWARYALRIETAATPWEMPDGVRQRLSAELAAEATPSCDWDRAKSQVTVAMDLLRRSLADPPGSAVRIDAARTAERSVRTALGCNPADGNLWYLQALLEQRGGADWDRVQTLLLLAAALAPREADLLARRADLVALELSQSGTALALDMKADLHRAIALARVESAAAILTSLRAHGRQALAEDLVADLPAERLQALETGTSWRRSTFGRPERYRRYEYRPFGEPGR